MRVTTDAVRQGASIVAHDVQTLTQRGFEEGSYHMQGALDLAKLQAHAM